MQKKTKLETLTTSENTSSNNPNTKDQQQITRQQIPKYKVASNQQLTWLVFIPVQLLMGGGDLKVCISIRLSFTVCSDVWTVDLLDLWNFGVWDVWIVSTFDLYVVGTF